MPNDIPRPASSLEAPPSQLDLPKLEERILALWQRNEVEARSLQSRGRPPFVFYDGPPFATGLPHYGHLLAGNIKDVVPRYFSMRGRDVERRFGWDCHGLPIESLVQEQLGLAGKPDIERYGVPRFNAACRSGVLRFTREWETIVRRMGRWVDFRNDYKTMDLDYMESVWWVFKSLWDKQLIYEGYRVQPVSPALGTPLSNFEVALGPQERDPITRKEGHRRRQDPSLTVRFHLEDEDAWVWAWTTTPWTVLANLALAVHPELEYAKVRVEATGELAYVHPDRLADYQERGRVGKTIELERMRGRELVGRPYQPLFEYFAHHRFAADGRRLAFRIVPADYVGAERGTGVVGLAPGFGEDDYLTGRQEGLPMVNPLDLTGIFDASVGEFAGLFAKDADKPIMDRLKAEGKVVDQDTIVHAYPHCYRTEQPLLYMAISTWLMRVEQLRDVLVENNRAIHWVPAHVGEGRFGNWLESARDWNLSRNRYWGTPLPVWRCDKDPSDMVCVGSIAELEGLAGLSPGTVTDLHRESVDPITFPSQTTPGGTMRRIPEVFDCWFESGSMPYAQNHYPFDESKVAYVQQNLPADFVAEGLDQTRGWFYTLHVLATALFDRPAFKHCIVNGLILAADGKKMSKRLKNYPDPMDVIHAYGADALRAYLVSGPAVRAEPMRFGKHANDTTGEAVRDMVRTAILPLWNAYNFFATYARADGWSPSEGDVSVRPTGELDRWILSRTQGFLAELVSEFERYELANLVPAYLRLCDDLNNWYIRRGRRRYWRARGDGPDADRDKREAYATLYRVLVTVSKAMAPVIPFVTEYLYQKLSAELGLARVGQDSVHLCDYPEPDLELRDETLEREVSHVRAAVTLGMAVREREGIAVRRPLALATVTSPHAHVRATLQRFAGELAGELNVKRVEVANDDSKLVKLSAKANFKQLGKRLGEKMKSVAAAVQALDAAAILELIRRGFIDLEGQRLGVEDVLVAREAIPGLAAESADDMTVALDINVTPELQAEGFAREIVNRVQNLRKQTGLDVSQRIRLMLRGGGELANALADPSLRNLIAQETLAVNIHDHDQADAIHRAEDEIDGHVVSIALTPVA